MLEPVIESIFPAVIFGIADYLLVKEHSFKYAGLSYVGYLVENFLFYRGNQPLLSSGLGFVTFEGLQLWQHGHLFDKQALMRAAEFAVIDIANRPIRNVYNKYL